MRKGLIVAAVILPVLYVGAEVGAKTFAEKTLAENAASHDPVADEAEAKVSSPLLWDLFTKDVVRRIEVSTTHIDIGPFLADRAEAVLNGVHIDRQASIKESEPIVSRIDLLEMTLTLAQEEVSKILPPGFTFQFQSGSVVLKGPLGLNLEGFFEVRGANGIAFVPKNKLPGGISAPAFELGDVPFVSCIKDVRLEAGKAIITCSHKNAPPIFPP